MSTYMPRPGDWKTIGIISKHFTWIAIKPEARVFVFGCHQHLETYYFEKGARISIRLGENGQELHVEPEKALTKRTAAAVPCPLEGNALITSFICRQIKKPISGPEAAGLFRGGDSTITKMRKDTRHIWNYKKC